MIESTCKSASLVDKHPSTKHDHLDISTTDLLFLLFLFLFELSHMSITW